MDEEATQLHLQQQIGTEDNPAPSTDQATGQDHGVPTPDNGSAVLVEQNANEGVNGGSDESKLICKSLRKEICTDVKEEGPASPMDRSNKLWP